MGNQAKFEMGIVDISFQRTESGKHATPTGHLNFHFVPLAVSYNLFPRCNQSQLEFFLIKPSTTLPFSSEKFRISYFRKTSCLAACSRVVGTCYPTQCMSVPMWGLKFARSTWQNNFWCYRCTHHITL